MSAALVRYDAMCSAIAECHSVDEVRDLNLHHRHLSESQRAMVAAKLVSLERARADYSRGAVNGERMARLFFAERRAENNTVPLVAEALRIASVLGRTEQVGFCRAVILAMHRQPGEQRAPPGIGFPSDESTSQPPNLESIP